MQKIVIRQPSRYELDKVQLLRHAVLDSARLIKTDQELTPQDFLEDTIHMAAFEHDNVVGTVRLDLINAETGTYEVRKMAVAQEARSRGVGKLLLEAAISKAQSCGGDIFMLDARREAISFFEKCGFSLTGKVVVHDDGVLNYAMRREIGRVIDENPKKA